MKIYKKVYTRENCLLAIQVWEEEQCRLLVEKLGENAPLSIFDARHGVVDVIYVESIWDFWFNLISKNAQTDKDFITGSMEEFGRNLDTLEEIWYKKKKLETIEELIDFYYLSARGWIGLSVAYCLPEMTDLSREDQDLGMSLRKRGVDFLENIDHVFQDTLRSMYPGLGDLVKYIAFEEVRSGKIPTEEVLKERERHYIYYNFELITGKGVNEVASTAGIKIVEESVPDEVKALKGQIAMKGKVTGAVRVLHNKSQIPEMQEGEILVTAMTTPDYLPAMKVAVAFVTDEGGITCHAAIVARELGKPCVIGTKIATQVLKDGDLVEVDAERGVVRVIEKSDIV